MFDNMNIDAATFNNQFIEQLDTIEGEKRAQAYGTAFVRSKIRELGFFRKILPPETITRAECTRAVDHDTLVVIVDIEHDSTALACNFAGNPNDRYIQGKRYAIPFYKVASDKFVKNETELMAYNYPVTKVIEENSVKDIQATEDSVFLNHVEIAITKTGKRLTLPETIVTRHEVKDGFKMIDAEKNTAALCLMTTVDHDDYMVQPATEIGSQAASEVFVNGYKYNTILGRRLVLTNKTDLVNPGELYFFSDPAYLGNSFLLQDMKFWIKKEMDVIEFMSWELIGMGIGNIKNCAKVELAVPSPIPHNGTI